MSKTYCNLNGIAVTCLPVINSKTVGKSFDTADDEDNDGLH